MNGPCTIAMYFSLINCNSTKCLQNTFPQSTLWFSKWRHSSILLNLGILWHSKHLKCCRTSTQYITPVKITTGSSYSYQPQASTNKYSENTLFFHRFVRGSSFLESYWLILSHEYLDSTSSWLKASERYFLLSCHVLQRTAENQKELEEHQSLQVIAWPISPFLPAPPHPPPPKKKKIYIYYNCFFSQKGSCPSVLTNTPKKQRTVTE